MIRRRGQRTPLTLARASIVAAAAVLGTTWPAVARACGSGTTPQKAIPLSGTAGVSPATSIILEAPFIEPGLLALTVNGQPTAPLSLVDLGPGFPRTRFWRVRIDAPQGQDMLVANAEYVLTSTVLTGNVPPTAVAELTRFTTGPGSDKAPGQAPVVRGLRLWRVRYPVAHIQSGNCVAAEYHGFITVDYQPAEIPNTAPAGVVHTFSLAPEHGGLAQTMVYAEATPFQGLAPSGDYPYPIGGWHPDLDPTRAHCLTISAFGDGDRARLNVTSNVVCAEVVQLSATGAPPPPTVGSGSGGQAGAGGSAGSGGEAGTGGAVGGGGAVGTGDGGLAGASGTAGGGGGCSAGGDRRPSLSAASIALALVLIAAGYGRRRRRARIAEGRGSLSR